jgi:hypothetical protein
VVFFRQKACKIEKKYQDDRIERCQYEKQKDKRVVNIFEYYKYTEAAAQNGAVSGFL